MSASRKLQLLESESVTWLVLLRCSVYPIGLWIYCGSIRNTVTIVIINFHSKKSLQIGSLTFYEIYRGGNKRRIGNPVEQVFLRKQLTIFYDKTIKALIGNF